MANISKEQREDRERKEADEILIRGDDTYLEIEAFKEYEFSWCIAFEMAKRDPELKSKVLRFIEFYKSHKALIDHIPEDRDFFSEADGYHKHRKSAGYLCLWLRLPPSGILAQAYRPLLYFRQRNCTEDG